MTAHEQPLRFLKKQAKALSKSVANGDEAALSRARQALRHLPKPELSLMKAQHVIAVEYGFKSWDACCQASAAELYKMITKTHKRRRFDVQTQARIREILREQQVRIPPESLCRPIHAFSIYPIIGGASSTLQAAIEMANENARRREWGIDLVHYSIAVSEHQAQAIISAFESEGIPFWRKQDLKSYWYALKVPHALPRAYEEICATFGEPVAAAWTTPSVQ